MTYITITLPAEAAEFANKIEGIVDMCVITDNPKSFSSEELQLIQIGATFSAAAIPALTAVFIELWKLRYGYSIKIGDMEFKGLTKQEMFQIAEKYAPNENSDDSEEKQLKQSIEGFLSQNEAK